MQYDGGAQEFFEKYERFHQLFSSVAATFADKFSSADGCEVVSQELAASPAGDNLGGVRVESCAGMGKVLVACKPYSPGDVVFEEAPAAVVLQTALSDRARLDEVSGSLPIDFDFISYEAHLDSLPPSAAEVAGDDERLQRLYMVFRVNGMQWGPGHCAVLRVASKVSHSCSPNAAYSTVEAELGSVALKLVARALRPLTDGEQVTFSYMDSPDDLLCPSTIRQRRLHRHKYFVCSCPRCAIAVRGDPCRGFHCSCGRLVWASQALLAQNTSRYAPDVATFLCVCGQYIDGGLLDAERECSSMLEALLETLGDLTLSNLVVFAELKGDGAIFRDIDALYHRAQSLGSLHWLAARTALLQWRALLAQEQLQSREVADCSLLAECIDFVETQCPELLPVLAVPWVVEAARFLHNFGWTRALLAQPLFARLANEGHFGAWFHSESWYCLFWERRDIKLGAMD